MMSSMEVKFDYARAIAALEEIAAKVEDPSTSLEDIDKYLARTDELVSQCRAYLRGVRGQTEKLDK